MTGQGPGSALARVDTALIGEENAVSPDKAAEDKARDELVACGFDKDFGFDISKYKSRDIVGKYVAGAATGNMLAQGLVYRDILEKMAVSLLKEMDKDGLETEQKVLLSNAINQTVNTHSTLSTMELKALEIVSHGKKRNKRNAIGPQIKSENTYVQINPPANGVAGNR